MLSALDIGDYVLTSSECIWGLLSTITDDTVILEFGNNLKTAVIRMRKAAIAEVEKADGETENNFLPEDYMEWQRVKIKTMSGITGHCFLYYRKLRHSVVSH